MGLLLLRIRAGTLDRPLISFPISPDLPGGLEPEVLMSAFYQGNLVCVVGNNGVLVWVKLAYGPNTRPFLVHRNHLTFTRGL